LTPAGRPGDAAPQSSNVLTPQDLDRLEENPLAQEEPAQRFPWVVTALAAVNVLAWLLQLREGQSFTSALAVIPYEITHHVDLVDPQWISVGNEFLPIDNAAGPTPIFLTLVTSMFLHASWGHLIGNMLYLLGFGAAIERRTGPGRFFAFYMVCGLVASLAHVLSNRESVMPMVGASGAISGILGAYALTFPFSRLPLAMVVPFMGGTARLPAALVLAIWLLLQWVGQIMRQPTDPAGVAFMAHIGGFLAGFILGAFLIPNPPPPKPRRHGWIST
jgi:membrane associated rhomboid family serine protease